MTALAIGLARTQMRNSAPRTGNTAAALVTSRTLTMSTPKMAQVNAIAKHIKLPTLPYEYNALEPVISSAIMRLHHEKHHAAYVAGAQKAAADYTAAIESGNHDQSVAASALTRFHMGGHINHCLFWENLCCPASSETSGHEMAATALGKRVQQEFGGVAALVTAVSDAGVAVQGSGWVWLGYHPATKRLQVATTQNQDSLKSTTGLTPLLGIDVWEHAYYLDYKNARGDYLKNIWKVINWKVVNARLEAALTSK